MIPINLRPTSVSFRPVLSFRAKGEILFQRGLGKVHQLFGDKLNTIIEELNETLAA